MNLNFRLDTSVDIHRGFGLEIDVNQCDKNVVIPKLATQDIIQKIET